jgi:hypothetical protein
MDQRDCESRIYALEDQRLELLEYLEKVEVQLKNPSNTAIQIEDLKKDKEETEEDIRELERDIAMFREMIDKLFPSEIGNCGFVCDGFCTQCANGGYDPHTEIMTDGDY